MGEIPLGCHGRLGQRVHWKKKITVSCVILEIQTNPKLITYSNAFLDLEGSSFSVFPP